MRRCEVCKKPIEKNKFLQVSIRLMDSTLNDEQDTNDEQYGDYCQSCVHSGAAIADLISGLKDKY